jgi:transposase
MTVELHGSEDFDRLRRLVHDERKAVQRDRYRVVLLAARRHAGDAEMTREQIAASVGRSRQFVDEWVGRYRAGGVDRLHARKQPGNRPALTPEQQAAFRARLLAGPTHGDGGACTLRGRDAQRILDAEFGVPLKLSAVYEWMHRVGLSCLKPRPRHRKNDGQAMNDWLERAPLLSGG